MTPFADRDGIRLWHADARRVSEFIEPDSVDLIITSPPYFALRSYTDGGEHYDGQIGSEPTPREFVDALIECTADWLKVLKPGGSIFVNLGDKYAGSGGHNNAALSHWHTAPLAGGRGRLPELAANQDGAAAKVKATRRSAPDRYIQASDGIPAKSLMGLPWRYALRCIDELGLILRAEIIWSKPNGLPESVTDRVRRSHEQWFHLTRQGRYYAAVDEIREDHAEVSLQRAQPHRAPSGVAHQASDMPRSQVLVDQMCNPRGKLPGSVWSIPSEPLQVPDWRIVLNGQNVSYHWTWEEAAKATRRLGIRLGRPSLRKFDVDHFAAFPTEWPRRLILGWSPNGICVECGEGRRPVVAKERTPYLGDPLDLRKRTSVGGGERQWRDTTATITGYACACPTADAPTRPAVILDPFGGTGTVALVARALGRHAHHIDLSHDYLRLAEWRIWHDTNAHRKASERSGIKVPQPVAIDGQLGMFEEAS